MIRLFFNFASLYFAIFLLSFGTGLYNTYMSLRLTEDGVTQAWVGLFISAYYFGLVIGVRVGHKLIILFGHIRAYVASAAVVTVMTLAQTLIPTMEIWLLFRVMVGIAIVTQYMALESWLNDQSDTGNRGAIFSFYMMMSSLGIVLGQFAITYFPKLDITVLNMVAIAMAVCLIPVALSRRPSPILSSPAPLNLRLYLRMVPVPIVVLLLGGAITGSFYSLAAVYATKKGLDAMEVSTFLSVAVLAGLFAQWPMGYLSDRFNRLRMLRVSSSLLFLVAVPLVFLNEISYSSLLMLVACMGCLQFTFYPLSVALANEHVSPALRVGLSGALLLAFSMGGAIGPIIAGQLMDMENEDMYFLFVVVCSAIMFVFVSKMRANYRPNMETGQFVPMAVDVSPAPVVYELDPRIDVEQDVSADTDVMEQVRDVVMNTEDPVSPLTVLIEEEAPQSAQEDSATESQI